MTDLLAEYRTIAFWQRLTAAGIALAVLPMLAAILLFGLNTYARIALGHDPDFLFGYNPGEPEAMRLAREVLEVSVLTPFLAWTGFLVLMPLTARWRPDLFLRRWWATSVLGGAVGVGLMMVTFLIVMAFEGFAFGVDPVKELVLPGLVVGGYGAAYALLYWIVLRRLFLRPPPSAEEVFS